MNFDWQMAKGTADGETNLAIGEPFVVQDLFLNRLHVWLKSKKLGLYPAVGGEPELLEELHRLHPQYKYIVVANGAKQAIEASLHAFRVVDRASYVFHQAPYWPSYPTLAENQGMGFNKMGGVPQSVEVYCVTAPNNPDGSQPALYKRAPDLWDAAYAQPMYGWNGIPVPARVTIYSAAKMLGLSGIRVGWLGTNEKALADAASYHVETTTSGVSVMSQMHLMRCLEALRDPAQMAKMTEAAFQARTAMIENGMAFQLHLGRLMDEVRGFPLDGTGMFAWFKAYLPDRFERALAAARVKVVTGEACGMAERGWYRMSMAHRNDVTKDALERLEREYYATGVGG